MSRAQRSVLRFDWLEAALQVVLEVQSGRVEMARVHSMSREIVALCRDQRDRVAAAERVLDENRNTMSCAQKNEVLRLIAEALLYIQSGGVRIRVTDDPRRILRG